MSKSRRNRKSSLLNNISKTSARALPALGKGLKTVGIAAKDVAVKSTPVIEKGVSTVYGTIATGFDLGVKGAKNVAMGLKQGTKKRRTKKHRSARKSHRRR
jgi:hypothetical protein